MKTNSVKELQRIVELVNSVDFDFNTPEYNKSQLSEISECVRRVLFLESQNTSTKFDIWKMVSNDKIRPVMCGIFHDNGFKVASDTHSLFVVKADYDPEFEGKILANNGDSIDGKYPKYRELFVPAEKMADKPVKVDSAAVYELAKREKAAKRAAGKYGDYRRGFIKIGEAFFKVEQMEKVCKFMDSEGITEFYTNGPRRAAAAYAENGGWAIVMPAGYMKVNYSDVPISAVLEKNPEKVDIIEFTA